VKIRKVLVSSAADVGRRSVDGTAGITVEAELEEGDDFDEVTTELQAKAEAGVRRHVEHIRAAEEMRRAGSPAPDTDQMSRAARTQSMVRQAQDQQLAASLRRTQAMLGAVRPVADAPRYIGPAARAVRGRQRLFRWGGRNK